MRSIAALMVVGGALAMSAAAAQAPHASSNSCLTPYRRAFGRRRTVSVGRLCSSNRRPRRLTCRRLTTSYLLA